MTTTEKVWTGIAIIAAIAIGYAIFVAPRAPQFGSDTPLTTVSYACDAGKSVTAAYYDGATIPSTATDTPPTPGGSVLLAFADGSTRSLHQTISADGARYATSDESFIFWSKGNGALVLINGKESTYTNCIAVVPDPGTLPLVYQNGSAGITIRYPTDFGIDDSYQYHALGPGKDISGVKFTIPHALAAGTNLSSDSYASVELLPGAINSCSAEAYLSGAKSAGFVDIGDRRYSVATASDAGAGNRYEETVYATPISGGCIGVRYFIHYSVIDNYPTGTATEFDRPALMSIFDSIRNTLTIAD
jgi:membrane-bound inhibitor of C-type lysozyme